LYETLRVGFPENDDAPCLILPDGSVISYGRVEQEMETFQEFRSAPAPSKKGADRW
jgi:hypothetical protein